MRPLLLSLALAACALAEERKYDDNKPDGSKSFGDVGSQAGAAGPSRFSLTADH